MPAKRKRSRTAKLHHKPPHKPYHKSYRGPSPVVAIVALLLNMFFLPGLGSLVGGRTTTGAIQLILFLVGIPLCFILIGIPLVFGIWIWGIVTGVQLIREAEQH